MIPGYLVHDQYAQGAWNDFTGRLNYTTQVCSTVDSFYCGDQWRTHDMPLILGEVRWSGHEPSSPFKVNIKRERILRTWAFNRSGFARWCESWLRPWRKLEWPHSMPTTLYLMHDPRKYRRCDCLRCLAWWAQHMNTGERLIYDQR